MLLLRLTWSDESVHLNEHLAMVGQHPRQITFIDLWCQEDTDCSAPSVAGVVHVNSAMGVIYDMFAQ